MRHRDSAGLVMAMALVSGCFQEEAPRLAAPAPVPAAIIEPQKEDSAGVADLEDAMRADADPEVRREAIYAIADADEPDDAALIGQALYDPDPGVRLAAIEALTGARSASSSDWLSVALGDPDPRIRRTAVEALGEIGGETARFLLQQALGDVDADVSEAARQMLDEPPRVRRELS
ncbi:MAG TPA: HEAT repeat domain-containing protein [Steroidobacteraceae bacterium]